jgi:dipeptidyl aminopeptidase/acylaminoacyl peptidase
VGYLRTTLASVSSLFAFVLVFGFPASGQETTEVERSRNGNIGFVSEREDDTEIFEMRPDGSGATQLTHNTLVTDLSPAWSPNGRKMAFVRALPLGEGQVLEKIFIMNADGTGVKNLTNQPQVHDVEATWSPDGNQIAFVRGDCAGAGQAPCDIWRMRADGSSQTQITRNADDNYSPDWLPLGAGVIAQGNGDGTGANQGSEVDTGSGQGIVDRRVIPEATSRRTLPRTGGAAILTPAIGLLLISGAVARWVVHRRWYSSVEGRVCNRWSRWDSVTASQRR